MSGPRTHRLLLRLYPKSFRDEYGEELRRVFERRRRDADGPLAVAAFWAAEAADTLQNALYVHADILRQDLRHTARASRRSPGFVLAALLVTALGIGATTAAFTLADHVLIRPLPFAEPDRLVKIWQGDADRPAALRGLAGTNDVAPANFRDWQSMSTSFAAMGAYAFVSSNLVGTGDPERLAGVSVTADALTAIGVLPAIGRMLTADDDLAGAPCALLISDGLWRRKFIAEPAILGRSIVLDGESCHIAGVMPAGFVFPVRETAFWRPLRFGPDAFEDRGDTYLRVVARLETGVSGEQAAGDLARISARLAEAYPDTNREVSAVVMAWRDEISSQARTLLLALAGASACLLLIACTNLASLFFARATAYARELSIRSALGAGSDRLIRQLLTESVTLAIAGAAVGVALAIAAVPLAARLVPTALPIAEAPSADLRMLLVAALATVVTALACSVLPAIRASRRSHADALRGGARTGASRRTERLRGALVVAQVTASVALMICAGLLLRALWRVQRIDPGFQAGGVLTLRLNLPWSTYAPHAARVKFYDRVVEDTTALPGVASAAFASYLPLTMRGGVWGIFLPGRPLKAGDEAQFALARFITPAYFDVMGIPLKEGRTFDARDSLDGVQAAVVSGTFGRAMWPGQSSLGRRFIVMRTERTIVGVVGEVKMRGLERRNEPQMYLPSTQQPDDSFMNYAPRDLAVRTQATRLGADSGALADAIRRIVGKADPQLPISDVRPLEAILESETEARSVQAYVLVSFAAIACLLAAVGLYGLLAYIVSARTREIGVRVALGAQRQDILGIVVGRGLRLALAGAAVGAGLAYLAARSLRAVLAGIEPGDAATMVAAVLLSLLATLAACLAPALRAAGTSPLEATKAE